MCTVLLHQHRMLLKSSMCMGFCTWKHFACKQRFSQTSGKEHIFSRRKKHAQGRAPNIWHNIAAQPLYLIRAISSSCSSILYFNKDYTFRLSNWRVAKFSSSSSRSRNPSSRPAVNIADEYKGFFECVASRLETLFAHCRWYFINYSDYFVKSYAAL
jgi:hypothetical protein